MGWISNSRLARYMSYVLGSQSERLAFKISKLISVVVPLDMFALEKTTIDIPATAGNATWSVSPRKGHRLVFEYGRIYLDNDATAADRFLRFTIRKNDSTSIIAYLGASAAITANQTEYTSVIPISFAGGTDDNYIYRQGDIIVYDDDLLAIDVIGGVAGDAFSGYIKVGWM